MSKKIVISFPGGRGTEVPLIYFTSKFYEDKGYEKLFINHPQSGYEFEMVYQNAKEVLRKIDFDKYDKVVFIAKSIGTVVACRLNEEMKLNAALVLYTPLKETLPFIRKDSQIVLVAAGSTDRFLESKVLCEHCVKEDVPCYIEQGVGHRMEVRVDLEKNLATIRNVIGRL